MIVGLGIDGFQATWGQPGATKTSVAIGTFDGVHIGHQHVIQTAINLARSNNQPAGVITFDRNPLSLLAPSRAPAALGSWQQNLAEIEKLGVDFALVLPFDQELSEMSAEDFLNRVILGTCQADRIVIGEDFALGHKRRGTAGWLMEFIETVTIPPVLFDGIRVSSTRIRNCISNGEMNEATKMLGRNFSIEGIIVTGQKLGRELGYPTANLGLVLPIQIPMDGVYGGWATVSGHRFRAAISVGTRPTVGELDRAIEAFLIDFPGETGLSKNIYGRPMLLEFNFLERGQEKFSSLEELKVQMARDVESIRSKLS